MCSFKKISKGHARKTVPNFGQCYCHDKTSICHDRYQRMRVCYNAWKTRVFSWLFSNFILSCLAYML